MNQAVYNETQWHGGRQVLLGSRHRGFVRWQEDLQLAVGTALADARENPDAVCRSIVGCYSEVEYERTDMVLLQTTTVTQQSDDQTSLPPSSYLNTQLSSIQLQ